MESKSYWNRELLPLLLNSEKVFFHEILKLISERYIQNISLLADFIDGFLLCDDNFLSVDKYNQLGDFICSLKSLEFLNFRDTVHNSRKTKNYVPFIFELHVVKRDYETVVATYWDSNYLKESFLANDELILKFEKSFIFLDSSVTQKKPLFFLNDSFSLIEASCLISGDDPIQINRCFNDTNFDQNYPSFNEAYNFLKSAISSGNLSEHIKAQELKIYLQRKGKFVNGFNDHLKNEQTDQNGGVKNSIIAQLEKENKKLKAELIQREQKINNLVEALDHERFNMKCLEEDANHHIYFKHELEFALDDTKKELSRLSKITDHKDDLLDLIFDDSNEARFAPDLALSIRLWQEIYILNPKEDSHTNKANNWISINTGYDKTGTSASKIREITTPLVNWSTHRDKKFKK